MQKVIGYLNQWCKNNKSVTGSRIDLAEFWEPKRAFLASYLSACEKFLLEHGELKEPFGSKPPNLSFLLDEYRTVLEKGPGVMHTPHVAYAYPSEAPESDPNVEHIPAHGYEVLFNAYYYRLCAVQYFFSTIVHSLKAPSAKLLFRMDSAILPAIVRIAHECGYQRGAPVGMDYHKFIGKLGRASGRREKAGTDVRETAYLKAAEDCKKLQTERYRSYGKFRNDIITKMKDDPQSYDNQKPYAKTNANKLLKQHFPDAVVGT